MAIYTPPTLGSASVNLLTTNDVFGLADKIIMERLTGASISNQYPELEKTIAEYGAIHGSARLPHAESGAVDPNTVTKSAPHYPDFVTRYFKARTKKRYWVDYSEFDAKKVLDGTMSMDVFVATLYNSLIEGYRAETNIALKNALGYVSANPADDALIVLNADGSVNTGAHSVLGALGQYEAVNNPTFSKVFSRLQELADRFRVQNSTYSNGFECGADLSDIAIYVPIGFTSKAGFEFLSKWNNQGEANKLPTIYKTDGLEFDTTGGKKFVILVIDKNVISHVEYARDVVNYLDVDRGHVRGISMLVEDEIPLELLWKAQALVIDADTLSGATDVNIVGGEGVLES